MNKILLELPGSWRGSYTMSTTSLFRG